MKKLLMITILLMQLLTIPLYAQRRPAGNQTTAHKVQFGKLEDYVNDYNKRRNGERLIVSDVPPVKKITYNKTFALYSFQRTENSSYGNTEDKK